MRRSVHLTVAALVLLLQQAAALALTAGVAGCGGAEPPSTMQCCQGAAEGHYCPTMKGQAEVRCRVKAGCTHGDEDAMTGNLLLVAPPGRRFVLPYSASPAPALAPPNTNVLQLFISPSSPPPKA